MAEPKRTIFDDEDFRALTPEGKITALRDTDPDFSGLSELNQRRFLAERTGEPIIPAHSLTGLDKFGQALTDFSVPEGWEGAGRAARAGLKLGTAGAVHTARNAVDLLGRANALLHSGQIPHVDEPGLIGPSQDLTGTRGITEPLYRAERGLIESAEPDRGRNVIEKGFEVAGGLAPSLLPAGLAAKALGVIPGFAALEALNAADQGPAAALKGAGKGAALGAALKYTGSWPAPLRGAAVGTAAYGLSEEPDEVRRLMDAGAMGILALPGHQRIGPRAVRRELDLMAEEAMRPEPAKPTAAPEPEVLAPPPRLPTREQFESTMQPEFGVERTRGWWTPEGEWTEQGIAEYGRITRGRTARPETLTREEMDAINARGAAPPLQTPPPIGDVRPPVVVPQPTQAQVPPPTAVQPPATGPERVAPPWVPIPERIFRPEPVVPETRPLTPEEQVGLETGTPIAPAAPRPGGNVYAGEETPFADKPFTEAELRPGEFSAAEKRSIEEARARLARKKGAAAEPPPAPEAERAFTPEEVTPPDRKAIAKTLEGVRRGGPNVKLPKYPVLEILKEKGGVDPKSTLAGELRQIGVSAKSHPGLYRKGGIESLDDFILDEHPVLIGNLRIHEGESHIRQNDLFDAIEKELRGKPLRSDEQIQSIEKISREIEELGEFMDQVGLSRQKATVDEVIEARRRFEQRGEAPEADTAAPMDDDWGALGYSDRPEIMRMRDVQQARAKGPAQGPGPTNVPLRDIANVPPDTPLPRSIVKSGDVLEKLARAMGQTVQQGSMRPHRVGPDTLGYFETKKDLLKIRKWGDIQTASHELFHRLAQDHFDLKGFFNQRASQQSAKAAGKPWDRAEFDALKKEMSDISYERTDPQEGFSEFGRLWLTQKESLPQSTPRGIAKFEQWLAAQPKKIQKAMIEAQAEMHRYFEQGGEAAMESIFGPNNEAGAAMSTAKDKWIYRNLDDLHGLLVAERAIDPANAGAASGTYARFRLLRSIPGLVEKMWTDGVPTWKGAVGEKIKLTGKGLRDILAPVSTSRRALRQFEKYAVARMGQELKGQGREKLLTPEMIRQGLAMETPARRTAFDQLVEFNNGVADFAQKSGLFNETQRAMWKRDQYAWGLFREMGERAAGRSVADPLQSSSGVYALRGSSRNLKDPMSSIMAGPGRLVQLSLENLAKRDLGALLERPKGGLMGRRLPPDSKTARVSMEAVEAAVSEAAKQAGVTLPKGHLTNAGYADFLSIFAGKQKPFGENVMSYLVDGKPVYYELYDPLLVNSVAMMRRPAAGTIQNLLFNAPRRFYQRAVTSFPNFWVAQLARDPIMASMTTKTGMQAITSSLRGYAESLANTELRRDLEANLGGIGGLRPSTPDARRSDLLRYAHRQAGSPAVLLDVMNPANWMRVMERIGVAIEEGPRLGEARRAVKQGASTREAAYQAREITTDFSMQGAGDVNQWLTSSIPFFRAMTASSYRAYRANVTDPNWRGATRARFATMAGLAGAYYLYARDKEWYTSRPLWERMTKWIFPPINVGTDAEPVMIQPTVPKAYEAGFLGNLAEIHTELLLDWAQGKDPSLRQYAEDTLAAIVLNFGVGLPVVLNTALEQYSNRATFTDAPIETLSMSKLYPDLRRGPNTPLVLEDVAALQSKLPYDWKKYEVSAPRIQAAFRSFAGPYAQYGLHALDWLVYQDAKPDLHMTDLPILSRMATREGQYAKVTNEIYDFIEQAEMATNSYKELVKRRDYAAARELYANDPMVQFGPEASRWADAITAMNKQADLVRRGPLSGAEKQVRLDQIEREKKDFMEARMSSAEKRITAREARGGR